MFIVCCENVLSVVTDNINISPDSAFAKIVSAADYYAFGSEMPGRTYSGGGEEGAYRYGFNGKEKDTENTWGDTSYDYGFRIYNPRYGKFLSVDPLTQSYPMLTPYQFASNSPVSGIDLDGLEYLNSEDARVEFKSGRLQIKVTNFHNLNYNAWQRANGDPKNWTPGSIGIDPTIGNVGIIKPDNSPKADDVPSEHLPSTAKSQYDNGIKSQPGDRYNRRRADRGQHKPLVNTPSTKGAVALGKGGAVLDLIVMGAEQYVQWAWTNDRAKIAEHTKVAQKVASDMSKAFNSGIIPERYQNQYDIVDIMNVVLQGVNNSDDPGIFEVGMKIYNSISMPFEIQHLKNAPGADATRVNKTFIVPKSTSSDNEKNN